MEKLDIYAIQCSKCNTEYGHLGHLGLFGKRICNKCCSTAKFDHKGLFTGCECKRAEPTPSSRFLNARTNEKTIRELLESKRKIDELKARYAFEKGARQYAKYFDKATALTTLELLYDKWEVK